MGTLARSLCASTLRSLASSRLVSVPSFPLSCSGRLAFSTSSTPDSSSSSSSSNSSQPPKGSTHAVNGAPSAKSVPPTPSSSSSSSSSASSSNSNSDQAATTHFGFRTVKDEDKSNLVAQVFHSVAGSYDLMNDVMSGGIHRVWKDRFVGMLDPYPGTAVVDVAGGTGDIAFRIAEHMRTRPSLHGASRPSRVVVCDINSSMLGRGRERAVGKDYAQDLHWVLGDAESLPLPDSSVDAYTIAFGIRNVTHIDRALREAHRVLVPGGRFLCLEFSHVHNPLIRSVYDIYSMQAIPVIGELVARDMTSYQYLVESIRRFPSQDQFAQMIKDAGFRMVTYENLTFGVAAIHSGFKIV